MNTSDLLMKIILSLGLGGGFGYINYYILNNLGIINIDKDEKEEKTFSLILFSILNVLLFNFLNDTMGNAYASVLMTLIITVVLSFTLFKTMMSAFYTVMNKSRDKLSLGELNNKSVRTLIFDSNKVIFVYLYGLETNKLLSYGCMGWQKETKDSDYEFEIVPTDKLESIEYDEAVKLAEKNVDTSIYINIDKKIKMVVIPEPE